MRAAIYARFSTDLQSESSIADQNRVCGEWCERGGAIVVARFEDQGISGAAIGNRPGLQTALAAQIEVLVVMDLTRLSRSQADLPKIIDRLVHRGVRVVGVQDGYDSARKGHKLQAGLTGIIGEAFREMVSEKTYTAMESRAKGGKAIGGRPYGYRNIAWRGGGEFRDLEVLPEEAAVVRRIFTEYAAGRSSRQIAYGLNDDGIPSPGARWNRSERRTDGKWHFSTILGSRKKSVGILQNELYVGRFVWNRSHWVKDPDTGVEKRFERPRSDWVVRERPELRIVDDVTWQRVRERLTDVNLKSVNRPKRIFIFSTLLKCGACGSNLVMADGYKYRCGTAVACGRSACSNDRRVSRTQAEKELLASLRDELKHGDYLRHFEQEAERALAAQASGGHTDGVHKRIEELTREIGRMVRHIREGMDVPELGEALRAAQAERSRLTTRLDAEAAPPSPRGLRDTLRAAADGFMRMLDELPAHLSDPEIALEVRQALRGWMGDIQVVPTPKGVEARWSLAEEGLLSAVGPRVAVLVAGAGFEPATFGL